jgi:hypothetical protein
MAPLWFGVVGVTVLIAGVISVNRRDSGNTGMPAKTAPEKTTALPKEIAEKPVTTVATPTPPPTVRKFESTFKPVPLGTRGNKRAYWEFLPSAYFANPAQQFPIVIFFANVPESGDGSAAQMDKALKCGPPMILKDANHPLHNLFEQRGVIVISAQGPTPPDWWHQVHITPFVTDLLKEYRVDRRRIYLTGNVAGALGLHELMDQNPDLASQAAAIWMGCSQGAAGNLGGPQAGPEVGAKVPYWAFVNNTDSSETITGIDRIAGKVSGQEPTKVMAIQPKMAKLRTATYTKALGWTWSIGIPPPRSANPILTLVDGTPEETWTTAYNRTECWEWLFAQQKP